jgi:hypothetical protein
MQGQKALSTYSQDKSPFCQFRWYLHATSYVRQEQILCMGFKIIDIEWTLMSNHDFQHEVAKGRPGHHLGYPQSHKLNPYLLQW